MALPEPPEPLVRPAPRDPKGNTGDTGAAGISWQGIWSPGTAYVENNAVAYNGSIYFSIQAGTNQEPDTSPAFWTLLAGVGSPGATGPAGASGPAGPPGATGATGSAGVAGPQGPIGATGAPGISWQGIWSAGTGYVENNAVAYNGSIYFSVQAGINQEPDTSPAFWTLLAGVGAPGATGPAGASGPAGPPGPTGSTGGAGPLGITGATGPAGLNWQGTWSSITTYAINDAVAYNGSSYIAIQAGGNQEPDISPLYWTPLAQAGTRGAQGAIGQAGPAGASGSAGFTGSAGPAGSTGSTGPAGTTGATGPVGLNWQGPWSAGMAYAVNDAVAYNGSSYIGIQAGTNHAPDTSGTFWTLLAQVGSAGATGTPGAAGSAGPSGATGNTGAAGSIGATGGAGPQGTVGASGATGPAGLNWQGAWNAPTHMW